MLEKQIPNLNEPQIFSKISCTAWRIDCSFSSSESLAYWYRLASCVSTKELKNCTFVFFDIPVLCTTFKVKDSTLLTTHPFLEHCICIPYYYSTKKKKLCERFEPRNHFMSELSMIVWVNVVLNRTVVDDSDWYFDNLYGSHLQSQSELNHVSWWYYTLVIVLIGQLSCSVIGRLSVKPWCYWL